MAYKPPVAKGSYGTNGQVKIVKIENGKVYFYFREQTKEGLLEPVKMSPIKVEDCLPVAKTGVWAANLSTNKDKLFSLRPLSGMYDGKFKEFLAPKDEPPAPKMSGGKPEYQHLIFNPLFVLTSPDVEGMIVKYQWGLDYAFVDWVDAEGNHIVGYGKQLEKSTHMQKVDEFMTLTGIWDRGAMKWQENILPMMQKRALDADKPLRIIVKDSFVDTLMADQSSNFDENEDDKLSNDGVEEQQYRTAEGETGTDREP